eukprot:scaffold7313_cov144-Skeletonema_menzelii.AAC.1
MHYASSFFKLVSDPVSLLILAEPPTYAPTNKPTDKPPSPSPTYTPTYRPTNVPDLESCEWFFWGADEARGGTLADNQKIPSLYDWPTVADLSAGSRHTFIIDKNFDWHWEEQYHKKSAEMERMWAGHSYII